MQQHWEFYINDKAGNSRIIAVRAVKSPSRTDLWKDMQRWLTESPFADFEVHEVGYRVTDITKNLILQYLANSTKTYYGCSGHHKADMNEMKMKKYKAELAELHIVPPSDKELLKIGVFNGDGAY